MTWQLIDQADGLHTYEIPTGLGAHIYLAHHAGVTALNASVVDGDGGVQASLHLELDAAQRAALIDALTTIPEGDGQ